MIYSFVNPCRVGVFFGRPRTGEHWYRERGRTAGGANALGADLGGRKHVTDVM